MWAGAWEQDRRERTSSAPVRIKQGPSQIWTRWEDWARDTGRAGGDASASIARGKGEEEARKWDGRTHGEDTLDDKVMELLEGALVRFGERSGELLGGVGLCGLKGLAGEGEAAQEPHEALGRGALLLTLLVYNEEL